MEKTVYHVYAGTQFPFCEALNTRTDYPAAAKSLFTRYSNKGHAYVELVQRTWDTDKCPDGCCHATLTTIARKG